MFASAQASVRAQASGQRAPFAAASEEFAWRILNLLNVARLVLGAFMLLVFILILDPRVIGNVYPTIAAAALASMLVFASVESVLLQNRTGNAIAHVFYQFAADLVIITALLHASGGISSNIGGLFVITVGSLSLVLRGDRAYLLAALTAFALLFQQSLAVTEGMTSTAAYFPTGMLGAVIFTIVVATQLIRRRVVETEAIAAQQGVDLKNVVELNEYIIQNLRESIVVVDGEDKVRLINTSATKQLGAASAEKARLRDISEPLAERLAAWRAASGNARQHTESVAAPDGTTRLEPHFVRLGPTRSAGVLIFLEDTSQIAERVQQMKLAALGRLSASIAHEIRNPLGALSHAGQLLGESPKIDASERRLTDIIRSNADRVSRIVESVLALSRGSKSHPQRIELKRWIEDFAGEYTRTLELYEGAVRVCETAVETEAEMDPTHLHQVVWNLCDNAVKYASAPAGAINVELSCGYLESSGRPFLEIADRGAGIEAELTEQVFEPFFTAEPGGTGLGLYISRELCEHNSASLRYHPRPGGGSVFRIVFSDPKRWQSSEPSE